jgi:hypothetical protein
MRRDQPDDCDILEERVGLESLQELSRNVALADSLIDDELGDPPNDA